MLVPLCGKTNDMLYYRKFASHVVGVELVEKAIVQFFEENKLPYTRVGNRFEAERLTLLCGDFFELTPADVGHIDLVYDRAALVALPLSMRLRYVAKLDELSPVGSEQLAITLEYDPILDSAPFSIAPEELSAYYASGYDIEHVESSLQPNHGMIRRHGLRFVVEHAFMLKKRRSIPLSCLDERLHTQMQTVVVARNRRSPIVDSAAPAQNERAAYLVRSAQSPSL